VSVPVEVGDLGKALADYGPGYLLTTTDGRVKAVTVEPEVREGGVLVVRCPGRGSSANIAANPPVTLVFPPLAPRGFSLLVDGTAALDGDDAVITASSAVLHRPAAHADGPTETDGCGHDCAPVP
jgi:hypothetical protein